MRSIHSLVGSIRAEADLPTTRSHISTIANVVGQVVTATENSMPTSSLLYKQIEPIIRNLANYKSKLVSASAESESFGEKGDVREFMSRLPPLAYEIARETKELVQRVEIVDQERGRGQEDYS